MSLKFSSTTHSSRQTMLGLALLALAALTAWEWNGWTHEQGSLIGIAYIPFFLGLIIWRSAFDYSFVIDDKNIQVISNGIGLSRSWNVAIDDIRFIVPKYKHGFLRQKSVWTFFHKYSSLDENPRRVLLIQKKGAKRLQALVFKADDRLYENVVRTLKQANPNIELVTARDLM